MTRPGGGFRVLKVQLKLEPASDSGPEDARRRQRLLLVLTDRERDSGPGSGPRRPLLSPAPAEPAQPAASPAMARNEEKAMSMLARWLRARSGEEEKKLERRPHLASLCETLPECEKWRQQILREITKKVKNPSSP